MVTRRRFLARASSLGAVAALAGCALNSDDSSLGIELTRVPSEELVESEVRAMGELDDRARAVVRDALDGGVTVYGARPVDGGGFVRLDGSYYVVRVTDDGSGTVTRPVLEADVVSDADGPVGDWSSVSGSDSRTLRCAVSTAGDEGEPCVIHDDDSAFRPEPPFRYLARDEEGYYRLRTVERAVTLDRSRYAVELVAESRAGFTEHMAQNSVAIDFSTVDLSTEQRSILDSAVENETYQESSPFSDALERLTDRLEAAGSTPEDSVYVRYDGNYYEARYTWPGGRA
jgi:hypothetical protein